MGCREIISILDNAFLRTGCGEATCDAHLSPAQAGPSRSLLSSTQPIPHLTDASNCDVRPTHNQPVEYLAERRP